MNSGENIRFVEGRLLNLWTTLFLFGIYMMDLSKCEKNIKDSI